jgi:hypothetical protein
MSGYLNAEIGEDHKEKLREIAEKQERNMTGQLRIMIDEFYDRVVAE